MKGLKNSINEEWSILPIWDSLHIYWPPVPKWKTKPEQWEGIQITSAKQWNNNRKHGKNSVKTVRAKQNKHEK
jgi:hypothetical protein